MKIKYHRVIHMLKICCKYEYNNNMYIHSIGSTYSLQQKCSAFLLITILIRDKENEYIYMYVEYDDNTYKNNHNAIIVR